MTPEQRDSLLRHANKHAAAIAASRSFTAHPTAECVEFIAYIESLLAQARADEREQLAVSFDERAGYSYSGRDVAAAIRARKNSHG